MPDARTARDRAARELERGRSKEAIDLLEWAVGLDPNDADCRTLLGVVYARTRQIERAFLQLERAIELAPDAFAPRCALGELYVRLAMSEEGEEHLNAALRCASSAAERGYVRSLTKQARDGGRRPLSRGSFRQPTWLMRGWR